MNTRDVEKTPKNRQTKRIEEQQRTVYKSTERKKTPNKRHTGFSKTTVNKGMAVRRIVRAIKAEKSHANSAKTKPKQKTQKKTKKKTHPK